MLKGHSMKIYQEHWKHVYVFELEKKKKNSRVIGDNYKDVCNGHLHLTIEKSIGIT